MDYSGSVSSHVLQESRQKAHSTIQHSTQKMGSSSVAYNAINAVEDAKARLVQGDGAPKTSPFADQRPHVNRIDTQAIMH